MLCRGELNMRNWKMKLNKFTNKWLRNKFIITEKFKLFMLKNH